MKIRRYNKEKTSFLKHTYKEIGKLYNPKTKFAILLLSCIIFF